MKQERSTLMTLQDAQRDRYPGVKLSVGETTLQVVDGPHAGLRASLEKDIMLIGRGAWCDVILPNDRKLSKEHCELQIGEEGIRVKDLGSRNGVFLDRIQVFDAFLPADAELRIGNTLMKLTTLPRRKEIELTFHDKTRHLVGQSSRMRKLFSMLARLGSQDVPVLLTGETGTGKTTVARALHEQSDRSDGPFVALNCGAISATLLESLFFGHEKGAFTGADKRVRGYFEQAHGGTLFLDEMGELPLELQPKLLDVLESSRVRPLGSERSIDVDVRLIASTHRDLQQEVERGTFRRDLYYRIAVVELELPPLRERPEDIPLLMGKMLHSMGQELLFTEDAIRALQEYVWPGNVRQLHNILKRHVALADPKSGEIDDLYIDREDLELPAIDSPPPSSPSATLDLGAALVGPGRSFELLVGPGKPYESIKAMLTAMEKQTIEAALHSTEWDIPATAGVLQVSRVWLYKLIKKHDIHVPRMKKRS